MTIPFLLGFSAGALAAALIDQTRWWIVEEIERALAMKNLQEKDAAYEMYDGVSAPVQWSRAKARGPIDLVRLAELPPDVFNFVLERLMRRSQLEQMQRRTA